MKILTPDELKKKVSNTKRILPLVRSYLKLYPDAKLLETSKRDGINTFPKNFTGLVVTKVKITTPSMHPILYQVDVLNCGKNHSFKDLPGRVLEHGKVWCKEWFHCGLLHRENDEPASKYYDRSKKWYKDGQLHRVIGPASVFDGKGQYFVHGMRINQDSFNQVQKLILPRRKNPLNFMEVKDTQALCAIPTSFTGVVKLSLGYLLLIQGVIIQTHSIHFECCENPNLTNDWDVILNPVNNSY